ncbi:hypothetical protein C487_08734 [Natrinema pallidum DSM 3751]|uniref:Uncharacterized protein n=1 Tax=Natrinema pallidum DSM 3751 TaxID=1227495 RepID=L9YW28_9EURY|nr:hypothetical protein C487_08734 [Natrinema pallidum DSM 3751]
MSPTPTRRRPLESVHRRRDIDQFRCDESLDVAVDDRVALGNAPREECAVVLSCDMSEFVGQQVLAVGRPGIVLARIGDDRVAAGKRLASTDSAT